MNMLKRFPLSIIWVLAIQFILGTYIALYADFPENTSAQAAWDFARGNVWVLFHVFIGLLILLGSIQYLVNAVRHKQKQLYKYAIIGLVAVLLAVAGGEGFMDGQNDMYSMLMSVGFIGAIVAYALAARAPVAIIKK